MAAKITAALLAEELGEANIRNGGKYAGETARKALAQPF